MLQQLSINYFWIFEDGLIQVFIFEVLIQNSYRFFCRISKYRIIRLTSMVWILFLLTVICFVLELTYMEEIGW